MLAANPLARFAAVLTALATSAFAQDLTLDKVGGALGGQLSLPVHGEPNEPYIVLLDLSEQATAIPALGITLDISDQFAWFSFATPSFFGITDGNGDATAQLQLPNDPSLEPCIFSLQAVAGSGPWRVSNLARVTPQLPGTFKAALNAPTVPIVGGGTVLAADNEWLFIGGSGPVAQRYQSRTEEWQLAGATFGVGLLAQTTALNDGRVLLTGGLDLATGQPSQAAAIYDPVTATTTMLTMGSPRAGHGSSLMGNGQVLISGGLSMFDLADPLSLFNGIQASTEIFDPAADDFIPGPNMLEARALHTSTTLVNGQVLLAGGITLLPIVNIPTVSTTSYVFNPASSSFGLPSFFTGARFLHSATALDDGRVLLVGGLSLDLTLFLQTGNIEDLVIGTRDDCLLFTQGTFFSTYEGVSGMQVGRAGAGVAPLPGGGALIAGGFQLSIDIANQNFVLALTDTADVFTQSPNTLAPTGSMAAARFFPITANLFDGTVMIVGGGATTAEIYQR